MLDSHPVVLPCPVLDEPVRILRWQPRHPERGALVACCSGLDACSTEQREIRGVQVALPARDCPFRDMVMDHLRLRAREEDRNPAPAGG